MSKIIDLPDIEVFQRNNGILEFYKELGFDVTGDQQVNPKKVKINGLDAEDILDTLPNDEVLYWMNYGPSLSQDIQRGKVELLEGWCV